MNEIFNKLSDNTKRKILGMTKEQQMVVMNEIIKKKSGQSGGLNKYFNQLPVDKQLQALQTGYNSLSKEFSHLSNIVPTSLPSLTTNSMTMSEELSKKYPVLSVDTNVNADINANANANANANSTNTNANSTNTNTMDDLRNAGNITITKIN